MGLKRTTEEAAVYFKEQGCELLDEYVGCTNKMKYRCHCGNIGNTSWNKFTCGRRCGFCGKNGRSVGYSLEEVQQIYRERGCELLEDEYINSEVMMKYRCKCGSIAEKTFSAFHRQQQYCKECGLKKNQKEGHWNWQSDREALKRKQKFRKKIYKALQSSLNAVGKKKVGRTSDMLGYSPEELQEHVEQHPNWSKVKDKRWHLDHIFPIQAFVEHGVDDMSIINALDNLQPVTQRQNNQKKDKYDKQAFKFWLQSKGIVT